MPLSRAIAARSTRGSRPQVLGPQASGFEAARRHARRGLNRKVRITSHQSRRASRTFALPFKRSILRRGFSKQSKQAKALIEEAIFIDEAIKQREIEFVAWVSQRAVRGPKRAARQHVRARAHFECAGLTR